MDAFLQSTWWSIATLIAFVWGIAGVAGVLFAGARTRRQSVFMWAGITALIASVIFSMLFEELAPLAKRTSWQNAARVGAGMAGFLAATAAFVYAGRLFLGAILGGASWRPGLGWLTASLALFGLSAIVYHGLLFWN